MLSNDIELNGVSFNVVPGTYKKGLRKRQAVSKPAARRDRADDLRAVHGWLRAGDRRAGGEYRRAGRGSRSGRPSTGSGWSRSRTAPPLSMPMAAVPSATTRAYGLIAGDAAYVGIGTRLYKSVLLSNGAWSAWTLQTTYSQPITGMTYFQDDVMIFFGTAQDIRRFNTAGGATTVWRTGEKAQVRGRLCGASSSMRRLRGQQPGRAAA